MPFIEVLAELDDVDEPVEPDDLFAELGAGEGAGAGGGVGGGGAGCGGGGGGSALPQLQPRELFKEAAALYLVQNGLLKSSTKDIIGRCPYRPYWLSTPVLVKKLHKSPP